MDPSDGDSDRMDLSEFKDTCVGQALTWCSCLMFIAMVWIVVSVYAAGLVGRR